MKDLNIMSGFRGNGFVGLAVSALFFLTGCGMTDHARIEDSVPTISVQGVGKVEAVPDEAVVRFGLTSNDRLLSKAYKLNTSQMNGILDQVARMGINKKDVRTVNYSVNPVYERDANGRYIPGKIASYNIDHQISVKIRDIDKVGSVIGRVMAGGTNVFNGIQFSSSKMEELGTGAKIKAVMSAKEKADIMADSLGVRVGRLIRVYESVSVPAGPVRSGIYKVAMAESAPSIEPGSMEVTASCTVVYEIIQ